MQLRTMTSKPSVTLTVVIYIVTVVIYTVKNKTKIRASDGLLDFTIIETVRSENSYKAENTHLKINILFFAYNFTFFMINTGNMVLSLSFTFVYKNKIFNHSCYLFFQ